MLGPVTCWSVPAETQVIASPKSLTQLLKKQGSQTASKLLLLILFQDFERAGWAPDLFVAHMLSRRVPCQGRRPAIRVVSKEMCGFMRG